MLYVLGILGGLVAALYLAVVASFIAGALRARRQRKRAVRVRMDAVGEAIEIAARAWGS